MQSFEKRAREAYEQETFLRETPEIDGIKYEFSAWVEKDRDGTLIVEWECYYSGTATTHFGQQHMAAFKYCGDEHEHLYCSYCEPDDEANYWTRVREDWQKTMEEFEVTQWQPELTF